MWMFIKDTADIMLLVSYKLTAINEKAVSCYFSETHDLTSCSSGSRKDVVNQCLELGQHDGFYFFRHTVVDPDADNSP